MNNQNELEIMHATNVSPAFFDEISIALRARARQLGFDDVVIRRRADGATALVAIKRREVMQ